MDKLSKGKGNLVRQVEMVRELGAKTGKAIPAEILDEEEPVPLITRSAGEAETVDCSSTWMFFPPGLSSFADWPDLAACRAPSPLLVQYDREDHLFSLSGTEAADRQIRDHYSRAGHPEAYEGRFYPGPHKFDRAMQHDAFSWVKAKLSH